MLKTKRKAPRPTTEAFPAHDTEAVSARAARGAKLSPGERVAGRYDAISLVLQGGGALGAYQAGVYQALHEAGIEPTWMAGISIGAINAALIAGNPPKDRVAKLREFWERITEADANDPPWMNMFSSLEDFGTDVRNLFNQVASNQAMLRGQPGFFRPRMPPAPLQPPGSVGATSFYDTEPLRETLRELVDFDRVNATGAERLSVGAVNVRTGNFVFFDNRERKLGPEHVMASGALPPGFPAVKIEGERYWDGGLVSNTPLNYIVEAEPLMSSLVFQVDLWSAVGAYPLDLPSVAERQKDITFSSRTRMNTDFFAYIQRMRAEASALLAALPETARNLPEAQNLRRMCEHAGMNIVHLIYRKKSHETHSKDYNFSRASMEDHWASGYNDTVRTLRYGDWLDPPSKKRGVVTHDIHRHGKD